MIRFRRLTCAPQHVDMDAMGLTERLNEEIEAFNVCAASAGLPWIDKVMYRKELLEQATVSSLGRIAKLNAVLTHQASLSTQILYHTRRREELIATLLMTCAFDHAHEECSHSAHRKACEMLREVDDATDAVIGLIRAWRQALALPLPFMVDGENYLLRIGSQIALGKGLAHVGGHLRNTCRHLQFYYSSSYDPVMLESNKVLQRKELFVLRDELDVQVKLCEDSLRLARMGMYQPVLRFRHKPAPSSVPPMVMLDNKQWKVQLILCFSNGIAALSRSCPVQDPAVASAMMQFAGMASRVLHKRYYLLWLQYRRRRIERRRAINGMAMMAEMMTQQRFLMTWRRRLDRVRELSVKWRQLQLVNDNHTRRRYMQKLYLKSAMKRAERLIKRAMSLRYFRCLQYNAIVNILQCKRKGTFLVSRDMVQQHEAAKAIVPWLETMRLCGNESLVHLRAVAHIAAPTVHGRDGTTADSVLVVEA